jgi:hypothetical protein
LVGNAVGKICFVFYFILHPAYTVDAYALTSIQPSLSLINMTYCTADTKVTRASVRVSASIFRLIWTSLFHNVVKRVRNRTARFRCVFGSRDGYEF